MDQPKQFSSLKHLADHHSPKHSSSPKPSKYDHLFQGKSREDLGKSSSPLQKYVLEIQRYSISPSTPYTRGIIYRTEDYHPRSRSKELLHINRNQGHFPFAWFENHVDGHDYLLCASQSVGYTIVQLDTLEVEQVFDKSMKGDKDTGVGFVADFLPSPDKLSFLLRTDYTHGSRKDISLVSFFEPMGKSLNILRSYPDFETFSPWVVGKEYFDVSLKRKVRTKDGRPYDSLKPQQKHAVDEGLEQCECRYQTIQCFQNGVEKITHSLPVPADANVTWYNWKNFAQK